MRILAVDVGTVRVGLALSDELGILASPLPAYARTESIRRDARAIAELAQQQGAVSIVVGLPRSMDGSEGAAAAMAEEFAERIGRYTRLPVIRHDERLTTVEAGRRLQEAGLDSRKSRGLVDSQAAAVLLESYLAGLRNRQRSDSDAS